MADWLGKSVAQTVGRILDQKYLFGTVLFLAPLVAATAVGSIKGAGAASLILALSIVLALVVGYVVQRLPAPALDSSAAPSTPTDWSPEDTRTILDMLPRRACFFIFNVVQEAVEQTAIALNLERSRIRGAIHARRGNSTCILADFCVGEFAPGELTVTMPLGRGAAGVALAEGHPVFHDRVRHPGDLLLPENERKKLHARLGWVVAVPVPVTLADGTSVNVWTLNIDGLDDRRDEKELQDLSRRLTPWTSAIGGMLPSTAIGSEA